ncbi:hypothetical protein ACFL09_03055 [Planctomycetota bacterium]
MGMRATARKRARSAAGTRASPRRERLTPRKAGPMAVTELEVYE